MDRGDITSNIKQNQGQENPEFNQHVTEDGKQYRVPYRIVKKVVFTNLKKEELIDIPHAARLQYRLMLLDPIIKARVNFTKLQITAIYNPAGADNNKEKISLDELKEFLTKQGVNVDPNGIQDEDYDYYNNFYSYAYNPSTIRERPPYGYSMEEWKKMKPEWEQKMKDLQVEKREKFKAWQENYLEVNSGVANNIVEGYKPKEKKQSFFARLFNRKKKDQKDKGFWFHGV